MTNTIFAITHNSNIHNAMFHSTKQLAINKLNDIFNDKMKKVDVRIINYAEDKFTYAEEWGGNQVTFTIVEIPVT